MLIVVLTAAPAATAVCDAICAGARSATPASTHDCHEPPVRSGGGQLSADHACVAHGPDRVAVLTATEFTRDAAAIAAVAAHSGAAVDVAHFVLDAGPAAPTCVSSAGAPVPLRI